MRGLTRRWLVRPDAAAADDRGSLLGRILAARGLTSPPVIDRFRHPRLTHLHDPGLLPGIDVAVRRLVDAVKNDESIVIYGDYDVDGMTSIAIFHHIIKAVRPEARVRSYVPHRVDEGYGINLEALQQLRRDGADLVISVDCGITAVDEARAAAEMGLDLVITDHHNPAPGQPLPAALAIVHPRLEGSAYPFGELCGAGVAFKVAWRFATTWSGSDRVGGALQKTLLDLLPLAALGTIADVVPLVDENRVLATFGLRGIAETSLVGLRALIEASELAGRAIDSEKVGFQLAPRLNACGRLGHGRDAVRLLTEAGPDEAREIATALTELNRTRQRTEREIVKQAAARAEEAGMTAPDRRAIVLADEAWHPGVIGIVCSRLVERYGRPVILLQREGELCRGSARSVEGYSIHEGLVACAEHLESFGGHDFAAGLSLATENLEAFTEALIAHANASIPESDLVAAIHIDCGADLHELDDATVRGIIELAPFGRANRRPTILIRDVELAEAPRPIGADGRHLALRLRSAADSSCRLRTVWWNAAAHSAELAAGMRLDIAVEPKLNTWQGRTTVEGELRDVSIRER